MAVVQRLFFMGREELHEWVGLLELWRESNFKIRGGSDTEDAHVLQATPNRKKRLYYRMFKVYTF